MAKRKSISASLRWTVFARDNFTCRYCGAQAGEQGVELAVDHIVSVADGGDNAVTNLATSCRKCNGGKSARSLTIAPPHNPDAEAKRAALLAEQRAAVERAIEEKKALSQSVVNMICQAYGTERIFISDQDLKIIVGYVSRYGADYILECIEISTRYGIPTNRLSRYISGIIRTRREQAEEATA